MLIFPTYYICFVSQKSQKITIFVVFKAFRKAVCFDPESDLQNNMNIVKMVAKNPFNHPIIGWLNGFLVTSLYNVLPKVFGCDFKVFDFVLNMPGVTMKPLTALMKARATMRMAKMERYFILNYKK